ncbi:MAG: hypothetical protein IKD64_03870 [Lachnospiraceae bacterium]|nr:hypothetical protein [Lachnospiraceae bacterium]
MLTERENMEICWNHEEPEWVPMINTAAQMIITPEINDRPLFMSGADWSGLEWELDPEHPNLMTHVKPGGERFDDITAWRDFLQFPDYRGTLDWKAMGERTKAMWFKKNELQGYYVGNLGAFERICAEMGHVTGLMAPYDDEEAYQDYVNAYADWRISLFEPMKEYLDIDFVMMHDDWGNEKSMFMSPEMWRQYYKEPERRMAEACHELGIHYMHHSCGYITPIVGDLVEIGVDSWHSVQPNNDLHMLKQTYGNQIIFAGGVAPAVTDREDSTEEEIRAEVRRVIDDLGRGGGLMASSAVMFSVMPNVDEIVDDEGKKYGNYAALNAANKWTA